MARLGAFCFPGTGHINPMTALAHSLQLRGHEVVLFGILDTEARVRAAGIEFQPIGISDFPLGTLPKLDERMSQLKGFAALRFTFQRVRNSTHIILRDGPDAVRANKVDALLVDQAEFAGSIADHLGLPWMSVALIPPMVSDDRFPPFWFGWAAGQNKLSRLRNRYTIQTLIRIADPILKEVHQKRVEWGLKPFIEPEDADAPLGQVTQLPAALEFEVDGPLPANVHYTGPFVNPSQRAPIEFPWDRLDGRPLIYASLGTFQNGSEAIFKTIANACAGLDTQVVISLGGGLDPAKLGNLPGDPILVRFAPQLDLLKRAKMIITHAGLNTVLESLSEGVPMVAIPLGNDQPGVAARVKARGAGLVIPPRKLTVAKLRDAVEQVLSDAKYHKAAQAIQQSIHQFHGPSRAAEIIEQALNTYRSQSA